MAHGLDASTGLTFGDRRPRNRLPGVAFRAWLLLATLCAACSPSAAPTSPASTPAAQPGEPAAPKTISVIINEDPPNFWDVATQVGGAGGRQLLPMVHQFLVIIGADGTPHPRLLAEPPSVERGTWKVFPDGRMETTWSLRPNVVWHDGAPFSAEDLVFSWQVNRDAEIPNANRTPSALIEQMRVQDATTVMATWSEVYPFADRLGDRELVPVPRHLLESVYRGAKDTFVQQAYWSADYVGLGPYRLTRWERGSHLELAAFDRYFLGRPRIDTIHLQFIADPNTMTASLLAQAAQTVLPPGGPDLELGLQIKQDWERRDYGTALIYPVRWTFLEPQKRRDPDPPDLADRRVRQALLHALDRSELTRALFGEYGMVADVWIQPETAQYRAAEPSLTRYPYDPSRARALLEEAGWRRSADGALEKGVGRRFGVSIRGDEQVVAIVADQWKALGVVPRHEILPPQLQRDRAARASFTGFDVNTGPTGLLSVVTKFGSEYVPTPENQWTGLNRGGYANPQWDELARSIFVTLEETKRQEAERELVRVFSSDLPALPLYFGLETVPVGGGLSGIQPIQGTPHTGTILHTWNVHEWDVRARS